MASEQRKLERFQGRASLQRVNRGTGSEHIAVVLETSAGERLNLVRLGGNPFSDPQTRKLAGQRVEVEGYRIGSEIRFLKAKTVS